MRIHIRKPNIDQLKSSQKCHFLEVIIGLYQRGLSAECWQLPRASGDDKIGITMAPWCHFRDDSGNDVTVSGQCCPRTLLSHSDITSGFTHWSDIMITHPPFSSFYSTWNSSGGMGGPSRRFSAKVGEVVSFMPGLVNYGILQTQEHIYREVWLSG